MFGVVPRVLWEKRNPPDKKNRIRLALRPLLIVSNKERIIVDTGVGRKYGAKFDEMFNLDDSDNLLDSLTRSGFHPDDITLVVQTHLHFDHCGWATKPDGKGGFEPTFKNARYVIQSREWHDAVHPNRRTQGSYRKDDFLALERAGLLELVDGDAEIAPGVSVMRTGGHTRGHQIVTIQEKSEIRDQKPESRNPEDKYRSAAAVYWGDLIPTTSHIEVPYIMGYDTFPLDTAEQKERLVPKAADGRWLCFFEHEPEAAAGYIRRVEDRYVFEPYEVEDKK